MCYLENASVYKSKKIEVAFVRLFKILHEFFFDRHLYALPLHKYLPDNDAKEIYCSSSNFDSRRQSTHCWLGIVTFFEVSAWLGIVTFFEIYIVFCLHVIRSSTMQRASWRKTVIV
jgi:hypothetical protein